MEEVLKCRLIQSFRSPKKIMGGKKLTYKMFKEGEVVEGSVFNQSSNPLNYIPVIKTKDGYIIPESYITIIAAVPSPTATPRKDEGGFDEAQVVENKDLLSDETKEGMKSVTKNFGSGFVGKTKSQSKHMVNGAMIGAGAGILYGLMKGGNKLMLGGMGALLGGFIGKTYFDTNNNIKIKTK